MSGISSTFNNSTLEYKSPISALLMSFVLPGLGHLYNGQIIIAIILMVWELIGNSLSRLNYAIMTSFHGEFESAHKVVDYDWGMYYPSIWAFAMWHSYNHAISINAALKGEKNKEVRLTGFFFGAVVGMNLGIYWHVPVIYNLDNFFLESPVFSGLSLGISLGFVGHIVEKLLKRRMARRNSVSE
ncbi:hypothetical protein QA612_17325 [Evansella sp. AB-P1]|uniref:hypothetical protein n=1 Tax=Evansella sp. AB-P1 TaxID=3037653 RepID=UPI00241D501E|nr:hypothetical protein [Evansella sp. AB-P1]MDG5789223.1 hypothetical protein [Evansella sp. AB-P1]